VLDDIQRILDSAKEVSAGIISRNKDVLMSFVERLSKDVLMNGDSIMKFFKENPVE